MHNQPDLDLDLIRSRSLNLLIGATGGFFLLIFVVTAYLNGQYKLAISLNLILVGIVLALYLMIKTKDTRYSIFGLSLLSILAFVYVVLSGGYQNTGLFWCYPLMMIIIVLLGVRLGIAAFLLLIFITLLLFYLPSASDLIPAYKATEKSRFIASLSALASVTLIFEVVRLNTQRQLQTLNKKLSIASKTDILSGLSNRRDMLEKLEIEFSRYQRHHHVFSVIMIDIDFFKTINDTYGHDIGDKAIVHISETIKNHLRKQDSVARWGGEEFLILLPETGVEQAMGIADKIRTEIYELSLAEMPLENHITASFGVEDIDHAETVNELLKKADQLLYQAKEAGRNRVIGDLSGLVV